MTLIGRNCQNVIATNKLFEFSGSNRILLNASFRWNSTGSSFRYLPDIDPHAHWRSTRNLISEYLIAVPAIAIKLSPYSIWQANKLVTMLARSSIQNKSEIVPVQV